MANNDKISSQTMNFQNKYFSTFASGFESVIEDLLKRSLGNVEIELLLDGLVVYSTNSTIDRIKRINFFTNSFLLFRFFPKSGNVTIEKMMTVVLKDRDRLHFHLPSNLTTFRIITSKENQHVSINQGLMINMEKLISRNFHLRPDRSNPKMQFWFLTRSEGYGFFGMRLTKHQDYADILQKGELRPELADILCQLSEPQKTDIFIDPFAGSGAIPMERAKNFSYNHIYIGDIDSRMIDKLKFKIKKENAITLGSWDATKLDDFKNDSINKIVTDPPWGYFGNVNIDLNGLYNRMLTSFYRILKKDGIIVILVGDRIFFEKILSKFTDKFQLKTKLYVLVSGKKAGVYKLRKI